MAGYEDTWVTVFGFGPNDLPLVMREFSKAGDILQVGWEGGPRLLQAGFTPRHLCWVVPAVEHGKAVWDRLQRRRAQRVV